MKLHDKDVQPDGSPSLPTRECGLKSVFFDLLLGSEGVTPYAGVWIEILHQTVINKYKCVTPYAGVWIEIQ